MRENIEELMKLAVGALQDKLVDSALIYANRAVSLAFENLGNKDPLSLDALELLADCYRRKEQFEESMALEEKVVEFRKQILEKEDPVLIISIKLLAEDLIVLYEWNRARTLLQEAYITASRAYGQGSELSQKIAFTLAYLEASDGRHEEALRVLKDTNNEATDKKQLSKKIEELEKEQEKHKSYYSLSENARKYAYTCAEITELISYMKPEYQEKILPVEISYYKNQARVVTCYKNHLSTKKEPSMRFETMGMWSLFQFKYFSPFLIKKILSKDDIYVRAVVVWIENNLCLIVTAIYNEKPADVVKTLQKSDVKKLDINIGRNTIILTVDEEEIKLPYNKEEGYFL